MLFLAFFVVNKFKEKTHASLIQSGMSFALNLFITLLPLRSNHLLGELSSRHIIVVPSLSLLGLLVGLCCSCWGPVSRLARLASLGSFFGLRCSS